MDECDMKKAVTMEIMECAAGDNEEA